MGDTYRAAVLHDALDIRIENLTSKPVPADYIAIRPLFCGICGSDLHFYFEPEFANTLKSPHPLTGEALPITLGHEFAGHVLEIGSGCATDGLAVGDLVAVLPVISDGTCFACQQQSNNACSRLGFIGLNGMAGGLSDRAVVPSQLVFKLPSNITPEIGALVEPLAVGWHAVGLMEGSFTPDAAVLVIGAGPVGCAVLLSLLARGLKNVIVSEPSEARRNFALSIGAKAAHNPLDTEDNTLKQATIGGFDAVFDCAGAKNTLDVAALYIRSLGTIVNVALRGNDSPMPLASLMWKEVAFKSSVSFTAKDFQAVIDAIAGGKLDPQAMITKRIPLASVVKQGFESLRATDNQDCKILVDMSL